jgi:hypothetical protein
MASSRFLGGTQEAIAKVYCIFHLSLEPFCLHLFHCLQKLVTRGESFLHDLFLLGLQLQGQNLYTFHGSDCGLADNRGADPLKGPSSLLRLQLYGQNFYNLHLPW